MLPSGVRSVEVLRLPCRSTRHGNGRECTSVRATARHALFRSSYLNCSRSNATRDHVTANSEHDRCSRRNGRSADRARPTKTSGLRCNEYVGILGRQLSTVRLDSGLLDRL